MATKTTTAKKKFFKVIDPDLAEKLMSLGFSYILDGGTIAFLETDDLLFVLQHEYKDSEVTSDNRLRF